MSMPDTRAEMYRAGWSRGGMSKCRGCGAPMEWWSRASGGKVPLNPDPNDFAEAVSHFKTCPKANDFSGKSGATQPVPQPTATPAAQPPIQPQQFERELLGLLNRSGARVVVLIDKDGADHYAWKNGLPAEDLRMDLITAANHVRTSINSQGDNNGNAA